MSDRSEGNEQPVWDGEGFDPWLPQRLRAQAQVAAAEREMYDGFWAILSAFLVAVARAVLRGSTPDPTGVFDAMPAWARSVADFTDTTVTSVMGRAYALVFGEGVQFDARPAVATHLAEVNNRLVGVADEVFDQVASTVARGSAEGWSIPETSAAIEQVLSPTNPMWKNRATVVARTETIGALNAGRTDSFAAIADALPADEFQQQWLATLDTRVRPTHRRADGQRIAVGDRFQVGQASLRFPGDPLGPPGEVIQCRCTTILVESGREVDMSNRAFQDVL